MNGGRWLLPLLTLLAPLALLAGLLAGSSLSLEQAWQGLLGHDALAQSIVIELRLPRVLAAFACGALLALAGVLMQALLRNPLADPYVLGVSGGAAVAALLALLFGLGGVWIGGSAFVGALLSMFLVFGLAGGGHTPLRLLLTGVVVASGWGAVVAFILSTTPQQGLHGMLFWLMGDLSQAMSPWPALLVLLLGLTAAWTLARPLNVLVRGELLAGALGLAVGRLRLILYLLASLLAASAVTLAGTVGFVGLVVPHLVRLLGGSDHRRVVPAAALLGGILLVLADLLARTLIAPRQLPVGVLTALLGVPLFLWLLRRSNAGYLR